MTWKYSPETISKVVFKLLMFPQIIPCKRLSLIWYKLYLQYPNCWKFSDPGSGFLERIVPGTKLFEFWTKTFGQLPDSPVMYWVIFLIFIPRKKWISSKKFWSYECQISPTKMTVLMSNPKKYFYRINFGMCHPIKIKTYH